MYITVDAENEDGSANCSVDLSHDEASYLINYAINDMLKKGIRDGKELSVKKEDEEDAIVIKQLKESLICTYMMKLHHDEDIVHNLRVRRGCKALLRHYMVPALAEKYIAIIEYLHEGAERE